MRVRAFSVLTGAALATVACGSGIQVSSDWDPAADFSGIQTFAVLGAPDNTVIEQFTQQRIESAIATVMTAKGFRAAANPDDADVVIGYQGVIDQRSSFQTVNTGWGGYGWGGYRGGWGGGVSTSRTTEQRYEVGTLIIGMANSEGNMIFQSSGSKTLDARQVTPDQAQQRWNEAIETILRDFPPGS